MNSYSTPNRVFLTETDIQKTLRNITRNRELVREATQIKLNIKKAIERFHMTSRRPYWCSKTMKRRP